jgi:signal transduction histidine kinase
VISLRSPITKPPLWQLPLAAFLGLGLAGLLFVDRVLQRQYRQQATTQAVQAEALLESFIRQRISMLHGVRAIVESARSVAAMDSRFGEVARQVFGDSPDLREILLVDARGTVRASYPAGAEWQVRERLEPAVAPQQARALEAARSARRTAITSTIESAAGWRGVVIFDPVLRRDTLVGFVGGSFAYQAIFSDALAGQLQGQFAYQVRDDAGRVIARSPAYPGRTAALVRRRVDLPNERYWTLEVAIPPFQPLVPRLINWIVGLLLLLMVVVLVVREQKQSERYAERSLDLEMLTRDLLDANLRLEERARQIAEANRAKSRFLANVSHELRTPLNAIVGYNALAREGVYGELPPALRAAHERIGAAAEHLLGLVNEVLDLSKIEVGRMAVDAQEVDVSSLIDSVVTVIEPMAEAKGLRLDVVLGRDLPRIVTDPGHVRQILLNLASNAVKFTERGSVAIIAGRADPSPGSGVTIVVEDTGIGIAPQDAERIFEEFEQVRPGGRGDSLQRGTGLGLTISRKLARLLGGDVTVQSKPGVGSRFTLTLPLAVTPHHPPEGEAGERAATPIASGARVPDAASPPGPRSAPAPLGQEDSPSDEHPKLMIGAEGASGERSLDDRRPTG